MWPLTEIFRCRESVVFLPEDDDGSQRGCQRIFSHLGSRTSSTALDLALFLALFVHERKTKRGRAKE